MHISDWSSDVCSSDLYANVRGEDLPCEGDTLAEGIAVKQPGELTRKFVQALADDIVLVSERYLEQAVSLLLQIEKPVKEGAGAAGLGALLVHKEQFQGRTVGLFICGGNISTRLLDKLGKQACRESRCLEVLFWGGAGYIQ